jgi:miniconductance mechanosensitive channel
LPGFLILELNGTVSIARQGDPSPPGHKEFELMFPGLSAFLKDSMALHPILVNVCILAIAVLGGFLVNLLTRHVVLYGMRIVFQKLPINIPEGKNLLYSIASRLAYIAPVVVVYILLDIMDIEPDYLLRMRKICMALTIGCVVGALLSFLNLLALWYRKQPDSQNRSIRGVVQLIQIFVVLGALIMVASMLVNKSPVMLLSGLGAVAAVLILIFQDTILALVSGIQLSTNHMIQIGDWIVLPSENVDGVIVDIALHMVKVQNWDMTIVTVPTRKLTVETFINWRGVYESGGRRIKRQLNIDMRNIRFLDDDEIAALDEFVLLDDYLNRKQQEIEVWNRALEERGAKPINGRRITNIGTFRIYVENYLRSLKTVNQNMTLLVRQLQPDDNGLPIEVYCFTNTTDWGEYERIQSDIFDHLLAILPVFGLRVFQKCSDICQTAGGEQRKIGGIFPQDTYVSPDYPGIRQLRRDGD